MPLETGFERIVRRDEPLAMHTWFRLGGPAEYFAEPESVDQLIALIKRCHGEGVPLRMLGQGSNVLVRDEGVPGVKVCSGSDEVTALADRADLVVDGPPGVVRLLDSLTRELF